jgi:hypothetical protein
MLAKKCTVLRGGCGPELFFQLFLKNEVNTVVIQMTFIDDFTSFEVANRNSYYEEIIKKPLSRLFLTKVAFPNNEN